MAGAGSTGVVLELAADAGVGRGARAVDVRAEVSTESAVEARAADASLGGGLAPLAVGSLGANAEVVLEEVDAQGVVLARAGVAQADVEFATISGPSTWADTDEGTNLDEKQKLKPSLGQT